MMDSPKYSVIIPVYNRPEEIDELLSSLSRQTYENFEVIVVEDGSSLTCEKVCENYRKQIGIRYYNKPNTGPGPSRNFGFSHAAGKYFVIFDSDCVVPATYFEAVEKYLSSNSLDCWGGPDRGAENFTPLQQAMAYTMSSVLTTGGIRGAKSKGFQPRSFNMGLSRMVFEKTGGFHFDRFAEDIELSIRITKLGFRTGLIPEAFVFHRRRSSLAEFFRQVSNFGKGRVMIGRSHPGYIKLTHWFPTAFLCGLLLIIPLWLFWPLIGKLLVAVYSAYLLSIGILALGETRSLVVSFLTIPSALIQLAGYGLGFLLARTKHG